MNELLTCVLRPDNTAIWLPAWLAVKLGLITGDKMTEEQFDSPEIKTLIEDRLRREKKGKP